MTSVSVWLSKCGPRSQFGFQLGEVLDDAVVNHRHLAREVGVGVFGGRRAVGGPAGVADADGSGQGITRQHLFQVLQLARRAPPLQSAPFASVATPAES